MDKYTCWQCSTPAKLTANAQLLPLLSMRPCCYLLSGQDCHPMLLTCPLKIYNAGTLTYSRCISSAACSETLKVIDLKHGAKHGYELGVDRKC